jgi:effector-binding domain-containing protein
MGQLELGRTLSRLFGEVRGYLKQQAATRVGPGMTLYYDTEYRERDIHVGACLAFEGTLKDGEQVKVVELPAVETMASVIHSGSFSTLHQAYHTLLKWIEANGCHMSGPNRELTLEYEPGGDESTFVTELQFPVEKR